MASVSGPAEAAAPLAAPPNVGRTAFRVLAAISFCHLLNDLVQSLIPALYPVLKSTFALSFAQIGLISLTYNSTASLLQPVVGLYTDRRPQPWSLAIGMGFTLTGLLLLAAAPTYPALLAASAFVGIGSAVFHPESSRIARLASGGRHGLAQSVFQVGGNAGSALGPLLAAFIVVPRGQGSVAYFSVVALLGVMVLSRIALWYRPRIIVRGKESVQPRAASPLPRGKVILSIAILLVLIFSKYFYLVSLTSYFTFYLIGKFGLTVKAAQVHLFLFLAAVAAGTIIGGPVGDRIGRRYVIWGSILGVLPFTLLLPHANLFWTTILSIIIGVVLASAFSAILVYAQELLPGNIGMVSGLFFGFAFGMGGIGAAVLGQLADHNQHPFRVPGLRVSPGLGFAYRGFAGPVLPSPFKYLESPLDEGVSILIDSTSSLCETCGYLRPVGSSLAAAQPNRQSIARPMRPRLQIRAEPDLYSEQIRLSTG